MVLAVNKRAAFGMINKCQSLSLHRKLPAHGRSKSPGLLPGADSMGIKRAIMGENIYLENFQEFRHKERGCPRHREHSRRRGETPRQGWEPSSVASTCAKPLKPCTSRHHVHGSFISPSSPLFPNQCCLGH